MKTITKILPHINIIVSAMLIVFFVIDRFNSAMGFLDNDGAKFLICAASVTAIGNAILLIAHQRRVARAEGR